MECLLYSQEKEGGSVEGYFTVEEAANCLGVSISNVQKQARNGKLQAIRRGHNLWITKEAIEQYRREHKGRHGWDKRKGV